MQTEPQFPRPLLVQTGLIAAGIVAITAGTWALWPKHPAPASVVVAELALPPAPPVPVLKETTVVVKPGDNLAGFVSRAGLPPTDTKAMVAALLTVRSPKNIRPGNTLTVWQEETGKVAKAEFKTADIDVTDLKPVEKGFEAQKREMKLLTELAAVSVKIETSLWDAFTAAGEDPGLAVGASDVLAWEMDFYRDVQKGDTLDLLVEKTTHDGKLVKYGNIVGVRYAGLIGEKELYRYEQGGQTGYFDQTGRSARRSFLKQPLPFVHITSRFGGRLHPILGYYKQHQGVDYGAPKGTPVWAVGDGVVEWAGMKGGNGNLVSIRHSNGFISHYAHLSGYGASVHKGAHVAQKQIVGYVGATGLATGPHLHFALTRSGTFVNPLNQKFPAGDPIVEKQRPAFLAAIKPLQLRLKHHELIAARGP